ncbi:MAG: hypothetical protein MIO92_00135, partial [Methanosarcinaceae archaeon]|nr:hypothetical protein [Methanosarcinaceae archaeon]
MPFERKYACNNYRMLHFRRKRIPMRTRMPGSVRRGRKTRSVRIGGSFLSDDQQRHIGNDIEDQK